MPNFKESCERNKIGTRLRWVRSHLDISARKTARDNNIVWENYHNRENNGRTRHYEEFFVLSYYFDKRWQEKYRNRGVYPAYCQHIVDEITVSWLIFGVDRNSCCKKAMIKALKRQFKEKFDKCEKRELELVEKKFELEMELQKREVIVD